MPRISVRTLTTKTAAIVRAVCQERASFIITAGGQPVAQLIPLALVPDVNAADRGDAVWAELTRLGELIGAGSCMPQTSTELLSDMRR